MSELNPLGAEKFLDRAGEEWRERVAPAVRSAAGGVSPGWVIAGVAALALGAWAVYHFGPDFRRYLKMERM